MIPSGEFYARTLNASALALPFSICYWENNKNKGLLNSRQSSTKQATN